MIESMVDSFKTRDGSTDDLAHGQVVIVAARWILVVAGLVLTLWNPASMGDLRVSIVLILGLAVANFFLHTQVLMGRPASATVVYVASAADIAVISLVLIVGGGFNTIPYVFYFPALLALSVAFPTRVTAIFAGAAIAAYALISVLTAGGSDSATVLSQMLMLAAVAVCGNVYWRIEGDRRRDPDQTRETSTHRAKAGAPTH